MVPVSLVLLIARFSLQSYSSRQRIRLLEVGDLKTREGKLSRVGLMEQMRDAMEELMDGSVVAGSTNEPIDSAITTPAASGSSTPKGSIKSTTKTSAKQMHRDALRSRLASSDPVLTPAQATALDNFSIRNIPQMKKFLSFFPQSRNSHGTLIARSPDLFPEHKAFALFLSPCIQ